MKYIKFFDELHIGDIPLVGGKNASLGEMYNELGKQGVKVPFGFATTTLAFREFIKFNSLQQKIDELLNRLDHKTYNNLKVIGAELRELMLKAKMPIEIEEEVGIAYKKLIALYGADVDVAVRSSATAEDLPTASFAGQHESYLNIQGEKLLLETVVRCFASIFTDRAIKYREDNGFKHADVALSVGVQKMIRSDISCSGIIFTLEPESGFQDIVHISGVWGLGENIVQGSVTPDEFYVFKPTFLQGKNGIISKKLGSKALTMIYDNSNTTFQGTTINIETPILKRELFVIDDNAVNVLAGWALAIEKHYQRPMDIEWAQDGETKELYIVQARPETTHNEDKLSIHEYHLKEKGKLLCEGNAVGSKISSGIARILQSPADSDKLQAGEILVSDTTSPDWDTIMKKAGGLVTNKGGRTSHASIVARELGLVAVVGTADATLKIKDGEMITVSCSEGEKGMVYAGKLSWDTKEIILENIPSPKTKPMFILGDPGKAFTLSKYPNQGVGLMRLEFIINNSIQVHPMALVKYNELKDLTAKEKIDQLTHHFPDKKMYFVDKLAESIACIASAFYPKDVIVRMSDFKSNEYANLIGGAEFEPHEENPMIGFRGASRYYNERYKEGFKLECEAIKKVRNEMGLTNVKVMIPFCRTVQEGEKVIALMKEFGLVQKEQGLEIYMMVEIPSNVILANEFAQLFDGFSIGSNDLTQLTLGIDRDSVIVSDLFDENNEAVLTLIKNVIQAAKKNKIKIGLCGQAPSDHPAFAKFLVNEGIDSISFNPDALMKGIENINIAEQTN